DRVGNLLDPRRRHSRPRPHLATGESLDPWHAHHDHARPHGVLRRLRDDHARHDHLCASGADWHSRGGATDDARACRFLTDGGRPVRHDDGLGGGRHHPDLPRAHHGLRLSRDPAKDPGPLPDVAGDLGRLLARPGCLHLGLRRCGTPESRDQGEGVTAPRSIREIATGPETEQALELPAEEPYYRPRGDELEIFAASHRRRLPIMLKGPTGCGKTRFVRYMAWRLRRPLVTVACHDDLSANDLTGRFLVRGGETVWQDGPLTLAARRGAICYLDEIVEARQDTVV